MTKVSPKEKSKINKRNYAAYISELETTGQKLPINQFGDVNLSLISDKCGFNRQVFARNTAMKSQLKKDIERIGTEIHISSTDNSRHTTRADKKTAETNDLIKELDAKMHEINMLKTELKNAYTRINELETEHSEHDNTINELLESGRRFYL